MPRISCGGQSYDCPPGTSLLDALLAHGVPIASSCRSGTCQTCLVRAVAGEIPPAAQKGLKPTLRARNFLLACSCYPSGDIEVATGEQPLARIEAEVTGFGRLSAEVASLRLRPAQPLDYRAGQYLRLFVDDRTSRCYSVASVPHIDSGIELHVRRAPQGRVSGWIHDTVRPGQVLTISEALGDCFYQPGEADQPLLLIATGCGLGSLAGIARDALSHGHRGPISLYHGCRRVDNLYWSGELQQLAADHPNLRYVRCVSREAAPRGVEHGKALEVALADLPDLTGWRVFLCGDANMVESAKRATFLAGASMGAIHADPHLPS